MTYIKDIENTINNVMDKVVKISEEEHAFRNEIGIQTISKVIRERNAMIGVLQDIGLRCDRATKDCFYSESMIESIKGVASNTIGRKDIPFPSPYYS